MKRCLEAPGMAAAAAALLCLVFTGRSARADSAHAGPEVRAGTSVGFADLDGQRLTTLGGHVALGYTLGPLTLEASYDGADLLRYDYLSNELTGEWTRTGATARLAFLTLREHRESSWAIRFFGELGSGRQRIRLQQTTHDRNDVGVGAGWIFDYDYERRPGSLPVDAIGWHFGWRMMGAGNEPSPLFKCSKACATPDGDVTALSLSVTSSLWVQF